MLKLHQTAGENVKTFTMRFLQICLDLGKNVPSDAPFTLNEQLSSSSIEQFHVKFMARSGAGSEWVTRIHGMSKADIDACSGDDNYISVQTLVEEATAEYAMLVASNHWGPQGKQDRVSGSHESMVCPKRTSMPALVMTTTFQFKHLWKKPPLNIPCWWLPITGVLRANKIQVVLLKLFSQKQS